MIILWQQVRIQKDGEMLWVSLLLYKSVPKKLGEVMRLTFAVMRPGAYNIGNRLLLSEKKII